MTAMLACEAFALQGLVAIEPVRRGRQYVRESLRRQAVNDLMSVPEESGAESPLRQLETTGTASIRGLELTKSAYERIAGLDFVEQLSSFRGRSLLVGISAAGAASPQIAALQERPPRSARGVLLRGRRPTQTRHSARPRPAARRGDQRMDRGRPRDAHTL